MPLQALLGMAHCLHLTGKPAAALEQVNAIIAQQPWFQSVLADKAKLLVAMHEWEHALEVVSQLLQQEPDNVQALHLSGHSVKPPPHLWFVAQPLVPVLPAPNATVANEILPLPSYTPWVTPRVALLYVLITSCMKRFFHDADCDPDNC